MAVKFSPKTLESVGVSSTGVYENAKGMFGPLKSFCDVAGDNDVSTTVEENGRLIEKAFNEKLLPAFTEFRKGIAQFAENTEAWERALVSMEPISLSGLASTNVKSKIQPVDMN